MTDTTPFLPARPTIYKGIEMRSRLEARFAAWMDRNEWEWAYEPECFATEDGQYLPDFEILAPEVRYLFDPKESKKGKVAIRGYRSGVPARFFVEVKPTLALHQTEESALRFKIVDDSEPDGVHHYLLGMGHASPQGPDAVYGYHTRRTAPLWRRANGLMMPWLAGGREWDDFVYRMAAIPPGEQWPWGDDE